MTAQQVDLFRVAMASPSDMSGLLRLISEGHLDPRNIVAILGKTEGNGCVNDFTREYASKTFCSTLAPHLGCSNQAVEERIALVMSGGTEGVLSPHASVFARHVVNAKGQLGKGKRLAVGVAQTREFLPEELGRTAQMQETAAAVRDAMRDAKIDDVADVHFVQVKCPLLTAERIKSAHARGRRTVTDDTYASMGYSRGASALGVAMELDEIVGPVSDSDVLQDWSLYSSVASASAGIELTRSVIVVMGNSEAARGSNFIAHSVMQDALDLAGLLKAFRSAGLDPLKLSSSDDKLRLLNVFAKAEPSPDGKVRGYRHTMLDDSDIHPTRHARAAVGGLIAGVCGTGAVYVSGGSEHQGPPGGGPIAVVVQHQ
jgi:cyanuric acid amidohydrolase